MSNATTRRMLAPYIKMAPVSMFLTSFFQSPPENYHSSEEVEIDVVRTGEDVAIVITDLSTGARHNIDDIFTNKRMKPPIFDEGFAVNTFDLIKREAGASPFEDPNFAANLISRMFRGMQKVDSKIRRAIEQMAAQVLQTGKLTLTDDTGADAYVLDFKPKLSHFPNAATTWGATGAKPLEDLGSLAEEIRTNGLSEPDVLIFGKEALEEFLADEGVQANLNNRRYNIGVIEPQARPGGTYYGHIWIGTYRFEMWTTNATYKDPVTGLSTPYVDPKKVIMLSSQERLDLSFGEIPRVVGTDQRLIPFIPDRFSDSGSRTDLTTFAWVSPDGKQVMASAGTRPLTIPTAIDTYGCLSIEAS